MKSVQMFEISLFFTNDFIAWFQDLKLLQRFPNDEMLFQQRKNIMKKLMNAMSKIPDSTYFKMKTKTGEDKFVAQQKGDYERIKAKALAGDKDAMAKFMDMKDRGQDTPTKLFGKVRV